MNDPVIDARTGQPAKADFLTWAFFLAPTMYGLIMFNEGPEAFWTGLLEIVLAVYVLLNWRAVFMPNAYVQHFAKYLYKFRIFTVSSLLIAAFLAWVSAPILFIGMLGFAWYLLKADPWVLEMKAFASRRWTQTLVVVALTITGVVGAIQYNQSLKQDNQPTYQSEQRRRVFDCATEEWAVKKVVGAVKRPCEDDPVKRAAMNAPGFADRVNNSAPGLIPAAMAMFAGLVKTLKYWILLATIFALMEMTRATAVAKFTNESMDTSVRRFLVESGVAQTEKNVAEFLATDNRTQDLASALCEKNDCHPAMLKRAGQGNSFYNWMAKAPLYLLLPTLPALVPVVAMYLPSKLNGARYQIAGSNMSKVLRGLTIERL